LVVYIIVSAMHDQANIKLAEEKLASQEGLCSMELIGWLVVWLVG